MWQPGSADTVCPRPPLTLTFELAVWLCHDDSTINIVLELLLLLSLVLYDRLTLKVVCESHLRWWNFLPNLGTPSLCVIELFAMYATMDRQTDGQTKATLIAPFHTVGGIKIPKVQERQIKIMVQTVNMVSILSCSAMLECDTAIGGVSVCLSVTCW